MSDLCHQDDEMLAGVLPTANTRNESLLAFVEFHLIAHLFLAPLLAFIGAVLLAGCLGLAGKIDQMRGGNGRFAELWPCFPAALALVCVALFVYRYFRLVRRRTIQAYKYADRELTYRIAESDQWITRPVATIRHIGECPGARDHLQIKFADAPWIALSLYTTNATALVERLNRDRG